MNLPITERLITAASFVRKDAVAVDVGCDHAYMAIYLMQQGMAKRVIATDIKQGPLDIANQNIEKYDLKNNILPVLCNGLEGIDVYNPTDIIICGMGGEMIWRIIEKAPFVKDKKVRLILQPMTSAASLRIRLGAKGFNVISEKYALEDKKAYRIICAEYDGIQREVPIVTSIIGANSDKKNPEAFIRYATLQKSSLMKKINGLNVSGDESGSYVYMRILAEINAIIKESEK